MIQLRKVIDSDLPIYFEQQRDRDAHYMIGTIPRDPEDRAAFDAHWKKILPNPSNVNRTIVFNGEVAGNICSFEMGGHREVGYWIGRDYWGKGIASQALSLFLKELPMRPLYGTAAIDNLASIRVLEKCGFQRVEIIRVPSNIRGGEIEMVVMKLE